MAAECAEVLETVGINLKMPMISCRAATYHSFYIIVLKKLSVTSKLSAAYESLACSLHLKYVYSN